MANRLVIQPSEKQQVIQALERIRRKDPDGLLKPEDVVDAARSPRSVLHSKFTWDDTEAAHQYRLDQARTLIRVSVTVIGAGAEPVRVHTFVSLSQDRVREGGGYRRVDQVLSTAELRACLLKDALVELQAWKERFSDLHELAPVFRAIERVQASVVTDGARPARSGRGARARRARGK